MYRTPPKDTRFKPGQSGNSNGSPKRLNEQDMVIMIQQIMKLYADAKSTDKTLRHQAKQKLLRLKISLNNFIY
ncbi:MAG: hypothetical protein JW974_03010 [Alphaproteobacteria bacterium]|nr:hypothetical protein [Alphaproteobacteria bacterium]